MFKSIIITITLLASLVSGAKYIYDKLTSLQLQVSTLKSKNKVLANKHSNIKNKIKQRRSTLVSTKLNRAKNKILKAPSKIIPFAGAFATVAYTTLEIEQYCEDIEEYKRFEKSLFGTSDNNITNDEKLLCGIDVENHLKKELDKYKYDSNMWIEKQYDNSRQWLHKNLNKM